ncbi:MAG: UDP-N-acetylmuramate dehydrogenase [Lachnospiraceae bacterium]|nr:UDP-N-acetylmuramate dehydrogenase [Lachnospiraceae bacterium]MBQ9593000.1 UDP-N-acetylmuramate dehydrogenase [Lachnospiraceae bacterium]
MDLNFYRELTKIVPAERVKLDEPLKNHTTIRLGGPAEYYVTPESPEQLRQILFLTTAQEVDCYILGNGSNVIFSDKGYKGVVVKMGPPQDLISILDGEEEGMGVIRVGAGASLARVAMQAAEAGLTGMEFAAGIPGTVGGALLMNAGAYGGEMKDVVKDVLVINSMGRYENYTCKQLRYGYRYSILQEDTNVIVGATLVLRRGDKEEILAKITDLNNRRREKQPLEYPSAGSTFKRPEGYFAGKLIEDAGLKGYRVGDMMISEKHAGFMINVGEGTTHDAVQLIMDVQDRVEEKFGVFLEPEVRIVGYHDVVELKRE